MGRVKGCVVVCLALLALPVGAEARPVPLKAAITRYADRLVRHGEIGRYELTECRKRRRTVRCVMDSYDVAGWDITDNVFARRCRGRVRVWEELFSDPPC